MSSLLRARTPAACGLLLAVALATGCSQRREINGVGDWVLGRTVLSDSHGVCTPQEADLVWCHSNPTIKLGDQEAAVDLYFRGQGDKAPLVEILLQIRACDADAAGAALTTALGTQPTSRKDTRMFWKGRAAFIAAALPADARRCEINFVAAADTQRIADLQADPKPDDE